MEWFPEPSGASSRKGELVSVETRRSTAVVEVWLAGSWGVNTLSTLLPALHPPALVCHAPSTRCQRAREAADVHTRQPPELQNMWTRVAGGCEGADGDLSAHAILSRR